jgi:hypothetical protein
MIASVTETIETNTTKIVIATSTAWPACVEHKQVDPEITLSV